MTAKGSGKEVPLPKVCLLIGTHLWGSVCSFFELLKAAEILPSEESMRKGKLWPVVYKAKYQPAGQDLFIIDRLLTPDENMPESMPGYLVRLLGLAGVQRFVIVSDVTATEQLLKKGDLCLIKEHCMFCSNSPLIGPNIIEWGERFTDASKIFKKPVTKTARRVLRERYHIRNVNALWVPSMKGYHDEAEKTIAREILRFDVIAHKGIAEAIIAHHMNKEIFYIGVVARRYNERTTLMAHAWSSLANFFKDGFHKLF